MSTRIRAEVNSMRKEPRQARSRATVEAIVEAAAQVLGRDGWARFNTNEVTKVAGVSIGSLYQYFPNKSALAAAVRRRHHDEVLRSLRKIDPIKKPRAQSVAAFVTDMFAVHSSPSNLHRVLLEEVPRSVGSSTHHDRFEREYRERYRSLVAAFRKHDGPDEVDLVARVLAAAVEGVVHDATRRKAVQLQEIKEELVDLVCAYLDK